MANDCLRLPKQAKKNYRVGNQFIVCEGSGLMSGMRATVIERFYWREATDGTYREPGKDQVPVRYENGEIGFMYKNRLLWPVRRQP